MFISLIVKEQILTFMLEKENNDCFAETLNSDQLNI